MVRTELQLLLWSYLPVPLHVFLFSSQTGLSVPNHVLDFLSFFFFFYPTSCPPLGMPSGLSVVTESLLSSIKVQLNCFITVKVGTFFLLEQMAMPEF